MMDRFAHLQWPFFEPRHAELARAVDAWAAQSLGYAHDEDADAVCRRLVKDLGAAGWLKHCVNEAPDVRSVALIREALAYHAGLADFSFAMQGLGNDALGGQVGDHGYAVYLVCHSGPVGNDFRGDAYAVAVSPDLRTWETFFVRDVVGDVQIDRDGGVSVSGRPLTSWTPEEGVRRLGLPQPVGTVVARAADGTYVRLRLTDGPDGCTGEAVVARPGDDEWGDPVPGSFTAEPRARCRVDYVNTEDDDVVRFALSSDRATKAALVEREVGIERLQPQRNVTLLGLEITDAAGQGVDLAGELFLLRSRRGNPALKDAKVLAAPGRPCCEKKKQGNKKRAPGRAAAETLHKRGRLSR